MNIENFSLTKKMVAYISLKNLRERVITLLSNESLKKMFGMTVVNQWKLAKENKHCFDLMKSECLCEKNSKLFNQKINNYYFKMEININNKIMIAEFNFKDLFHRIFKKERV